MLPSSLCVEMVTLGLLAFVSRLLATYKILNAYAVRDQTSSLIRWSHRRSLQFWFSSACMSNTYTYALLVGKTLHNFFNVLVCSNWNLSFIFRDRNMRRSNGTKIFAGDCFLFIVYNMLLFTHFLFNLRPIWSNPKTCIRNIWDFGLRKQWTLWIKSIAGSDSCHFLIAVDS